MLAATREFLETYSVYGGSNSRSRNNADAVVLETRYTIFTSMVTPEGRLRFVRASITFGEGFRISMRRLWIRISNCSRASLWTNVERFTVQRLISVGSGTGPTTTG